MQIEFTVSGLKPTQRKRRAALSKPPPIAPVVRSIVLAYQIEQAVREARAVDYADVARQLGMTRARISQILSILRLPPSALDALLLADPIQYRRMTERQLRSTGATSSLLSAIGKEAVQ